MRVEFHDFEDMSNPLNGEEIADDSRVLAILDDLSRGTPRICELEGDNGFRLLIGVGGPLGCVQHSPADGNTPYLVAKTAASLQNTEEVEFLCGGTLSPIAPRFCIPFDVVKAIVAEFVRSGERSSAVEWEEI